MSRDLLLEIGCEEIPSGFIPRALEALGLELEEELRSCRLGYASVSTMGTPRRLAALIKGVDERQEDRTLQMLGPPASVAFDAEGRPTKAATAFAAKWGLDTASLRIVKREKGEYVAVETIERGKEAIVLLGEVLPRVIGSLPFPKSMRWADFETRFARPIRWIVALWGNEVVRFSFGNVESGRATRGHRFLGPAEPVEIGDPSEFEGLLSSSKVVVRPERRREMILEQIGRISAALEGEVVADAGLLETIVFLTEYPVAICGRFDDRFTELPEAVLVATLKDHQKCFAVRDPRRGVLMPYFIAVSNTEARDMDVIRKGNERVVKARLEDAAFFFQEDMRSSLEEKVALLAQVVFHKKLGSTYDKVQRIVRLAGFIADSLEGVDRAAVRRAALLCKADLVTHMVGEFPELQGTMGGVYALRSGEPAEVATAIREHYMPASAEDDVPRSLEGAVLSIADKLDTLLGFLAIGVQISGTADPFALRRRAIGILRVLWDKEIDIDVGTLISKGLEPLEGYLTREKALVESEAEEFLRVRLQNLLVAHGMRQDTVDAVLSLPLTSVPDVLQRVRTLAEMRTDREFERLLIGCKRAVNILRQAQREYGFSEQDARVDPGLLETQEERELYARLAAIKAGAERLKAERRYRRLLEDLSTLKDSIDRFFDGVMVLVEKAPIRNNRLSLLSEIAHLFREIADFSRFSDVHEAP